MTLARDSAWHIITELGQSKSVHFIDLNGTEQPFNLQYAKQLKLCEEGLKQMS
jgi:hypothetical protein